MESAGKGLLIAGSTPVRGHLEITARAESLFVVNVLALEDYLRGVVPPEIGPREATLKAAVAAQAVAARTYSVKRLGQYQSLPFDLFADVRDQVYRGTSAEDPVADEAIEMTKGLVVAEHGVLIEAYYSSTCGGVRSDIRTAWPHREAYDCLRGGPDGSDGTVWCRSAPHYAWEETWSGWRLSKLVRDNVPALLELPEGSVRGELLDLRVTEREASGRIGALEYVTTEGKWTVPGDRNRWVLRREDGSILRSVLADLEVQKRGGAVAHVEARGRGNGHGVGLCQMGALERAKAGQDFRAILEAYYPGATIRPIRSEDLPEGRGRAS
jgi:stage II sporulation protein D